MDISTRHDITNSFFHQCRQVLIKKSEDYSHDGSAFLDFETVAKITGITREQAALAFMAKHVVAVARWAGNGEETNDGIKSRLQDIANYAAILAAMASDPDAGVTVRRPVV